MVVKKLSPRKKFLCAVTVFPSPDPMEIEANFEGQNLLLDRRVLERCGVSEGFELSEDELITLIKASECYRAKQKAIWYLSRSDYSSKGLYNKLKGNFKDYATDFAVEQMQKAGYLNDRNYAQNLAESLVKINDLSVKAAREKMMEKGVERALADEVLSAIEVNPKEQILRLIDKKYKNKLTDRDDLRRTIAALARRGFSFSDIRAALAELNSQIEIDEQI